MLSGCAVQFTVYTFLSAGRLGSQSESLARPLHRQTNWNVSALSMGPDAASLSIFMAPSQLTVQCNSNISVGLSR